MLIIAIMIAALLNISKLKGKTLYRTAIFLPCVTSLVSYSILFKLMFSYDGIINSFLMKVGILEQPFMFLSDPIAAKAIIILALLWRWTGYNMIFFLSAMQNIPHEIYEAARIDGANSIVSFFKITLPNLKPIILFTGVMSTIGTLQLFDEPMNLTNGGPGLATTTISQHIYNTSFVYMPNFGYAATMSYVIVIIVLIISLVQKRVIGGQANEA
ncbi:MAG: carbohydrate ABC transporter permease, partial [Bacilli bacterium]